MVETVNVTTAEKATAVPTVRKKRKWTADHWLAAVFLAPSVILIFLFVYGFIGWTGYISVSNWNSLVPDWSFAGLKNYQYLFQDFRFQADLRNTLVFTVLFIAAVIVLGQLLAILLDQKLRGDCDRDAAVGRHLYRSISHLKPQGGDRDGEIHVGAAVFVFVGPRHERVFPVAGVCHGHNELEAAR